MIYCFFNLLVDRLGGERELIIMMHGRVAVRQPFPFQHLPPVDLSDPHHFLAVKRGILQYTWLKPLLVIATFIMKTTDTFQDGYISLKSGYFWSGLIYNASVTVSLYSLALFWMCTADDLKSFRPWPKFLAIKLIIFASYWQGCFLSVLQYLNVIHDVGHYTKSNLALAIQDTLICLEMPFFAIGHWYAFRVADYYPAAHVSFARMPLSFALRDAFGFGDLVVDNLAAVHGEGYDYHNFDPGDHRLPPEERARSSRMRAGLRYQNGGLGKYWIPRPATARTGLLSGMMAPRYVQISEDDVQRFRDHHTPASREAAAADGGGGAGGDEPIHFHTSPSVERLYSLARDHEFGDYNYPVIPVHEAYMCQDEDCSTYNEPTPLVSSQHMYPPRMDREQFNNFESFLTQQRRAIAVQKSRLNVAKVGPSGA